jgi:hypothetical protein
MKIHVCSYCIASAQAKSTQKNRKSIAPFSVVNLAPRRPVHRRLFSKLAVIDMVPSISEKHFGKNKLAPDGTIAAAGQGAQCCRHNSLECDEVRRIRPECRNQNVIGLFSSELRSGCASVRHGRRREGK